MQLTTDQQNALERFKIFYLNPNDNVLVISGSAGTGKSTLIKEILSAIPVLDNIQSCLEPLYQPYKVALTATTNPAVDSLRRATGYPASTIHSLIAVRPVTDYKTNTTKLVNSNHRMTLHHQLIIIDEYSPIDHCLFDFIFKKTKNCKVVFVGDGNQLNAVNVSGSALVLRNSFDEIKLTQVVRQEPNTPLSQLCEMCKNIVETGKFTSFVPDNKTIFKLDRDSFTTAIEKEFSRADWKYTDSRVLAWRNNTVISYNTYLKAIVTSNPVLQENDYAINNSFISHCGVVIKTDELVKIAKVIPNGVSLGVLGTFYHINNSTIPIFMPHSYQARLNRVKQALKEGDSESVRQIDMNWIDLRSLYSSTINKAQGATLDKVFIDLDDISRCTNKNTLARLLYVAVSRARKEIYFVGDLV